ncbi:hypothetical protein AQJ23_43840, partial [Streptomyces antibioticus]
MPPVGFGAGLGGGAAFLAAAFLAGAFFAGAFFAAAFFAGAAAFFAGCFLAAEGREAIEVRLPVEATTDTCGGCFT